MHQCPRNQQSLSHAAAVFIDFVIGALAQAELLEQFNCPARAFGTPNTKICRVERQVLNRRQRTVKIVALRDDRDMRGSRNSGSTTISLGEQR